MNKRQERALEVFLYITFVIALFAAAGNSNGDTGWLSTRPDQTLGEGEPAGGSRRFGAPEAGEALPLQAVIRFAANGGSINAIGREELAKHADVLRSNPHLILNITAHAASASAGYRQKLVEKRAAQVYRWLVFYGAAREQLIMDNSGELDPAYDGVELQYVGAFSVSSRY